MPQDSKRPGRQRPRADDAVIGRMFRRSLVVIACAAAVIAAIAYWLNRPQGPAPVTRSPLAAPEIRELGEERIPTVPFTDVTASSGIDFIHCNGAYGDKLLPETMGGGCAFFDFDNDGHPDLLLVNSCHWPDRQSVDQPTPTMALYRNDGTGQFLDVTAACGLDLSFFGMGVAVGDYDSDGWSDLFLTAVGENRLLHNEQGKFVDVTGQAGVAGGENAWSTACGWLDYNNDGLLDLFVTNYVQWSEETDVELARTLDGVHRAYLAPTSFAGTYPQLYRNEGDGRFTDVSDPAGIQVDNPSTGEPMAKSLGVVFVDLDGDTWMDIVVANDTVQNYLLHNLGDGAFEEIGAVAGLAYDTNGQARGAMGIDAANFRNGDEIGVAIGNFANEMSALYVSQQATLSFFDEAIATGLGPETRQGLTFGMLFLDYDLDGRLDILAANGHLEDDIAKIQESQRYEQSPQLFWNAGPDELTEFPAVSAEKVGTDFHRPMVGRGATYADTDGDGDLDILITASGAAPRLLRNDQQTGHHWLRFKLEGTLSNRDAVGARIDVHVGDQILRRHVGSTRSYLSQSELTVTFGLGAATEVGKVQVHWPGGSVQEVTCEELDRLYHIRQAP